MGKRETKLFKEGLKFRKGKDGTKRSEEELLYMLYSPEEVKAAEDRIISKRIAKRDKELKRKGIKIDSKSPGEDREYQYVRIIPERGIINKEGITEQQFYDDNYPGYKEKYMLSAYRHENGDPRLIKVETRGKFTKKEQEEYDKIMKAKEDLEKMQKAFEGEEK